MIKNVSRGGIQTIHQTHAMVLWLSGIEDLDAPPLSIDAFRPSSIARLPV
jgi:hypothetical protein